MNNNRSSSMLQSMFKHLITFPSLYWSRHDMLRSLFQNFFLSHFLGIITSHFFRNCVQESCITNIAFFKFVLATLLMIDIYLCYIARRGRERGCHRPLGRGPRVDNALKISGPILTVQTYLPMSHVSCPHAIIL